MAFRDVRLMAGSHHSNSGRAQYVELFERTRLWVFHRERCPTHMVEGTGFPCPDVAPDGMRYASSGESVAGRGTLGASDGKD